MHTLFVTEAHEGIINFIDAIPNVVNFGEFSTVSYLFGFNPILATCISRGLKLSSKYRTGLKFSARSKILTVSHHRNILEISNSEIPTLSTKIREVLVVA